MIYKRYPLWDFQHAHWICPRSSMISCWICNSTLSIEPSVRARGVKEIDLGNSKERT